MIDPKMAKLKMLQELQEYAKMALKDRVGGGAGPPASSEPIPGVEEAEEPSQENEMEPTEAGASAEAGELDPAALEQLLAMMNEQE